MCKMRIGEGKRIKSCTKYREYSFAPFFLKKKKIRIIITHLYIVHVIR